MADGAQTEQMALQEMAQHLDEMRTQQAELKGEIGDMFSEMKADLLGILKQALKLPEQTTVTNPNPSVETVTNLEPFVEPMKSSGPFIESLKHASVLQVPGSVSDVFLVHRVDSHVKEVEELPQESTNGNEKNVAYQVFDQMPNEYQKDLTVIESSNKEVLSFSYKDARVWEPGGLPTKMDHWDCLRIDGTLLREWFRRCDEYFDLHKTPPEMRVRVASPHMIASHVRQFDVTTVADAVWIAKHCESSLLQHSSATQNRAPFNPYQSYNDQPLDTTMSVKRECREIVLIDKGDRAWALELRFNRVGNGEILVLSLCPAEKASKESFPVKVMHWINQMNEAGYSPNEKIVYTFTYRLCQAKRDHEAIRLSLDLLDCGSLTGMLCEPKPEVEVTVLLEGNMNIKRTTFFGRNVVKWKCWLVMGSRLPLHYWVTWRKLIVWEVLCLLQNDVHRLLQSVSEMKQRIIVSLWKSLGYLMEAHDSKYEGLVCVLERKKLRNIEADINHLRKLLATMEGLAQKIACGLIYGDVKFHLKHKWRSRLLQTLSRLEFGVVSVLFFTSSVKLLFPKNHKSLHYEAGFCSHYNGLEQLSTEFQGSLGLNFFTYLIFIWNQTLNCGCEAGYISSGFFSVGDIHGDETLSKRLLVLNEMSLLDNENDVDLIFKGYWFHNEPMIGTCFSLMKNIESLKESVQLEDAAKGIMSYESNIGHVEKSLTEFSVYGVFHLQRPPELGQTKQYGQELYQVFCLSSLRTRMFRRGKYCDRIISNPGSHKPDFS